MMQKTKTTNIDDISREIFSILDQSKNVLIVSHINPDGDAIGTQLAMASYLRSIGKTVCLFRDDEIPRNLHFLAGAENIPLFNLSDSEKDALQIDTVVLLECPQIERTGNIRELITDNVKIINIDHHQDNAMFGDVIWVDSSISSVGEMVFEFFANQNFKISESVAEQLYTAILTDTGRFRFGSTSKRTMEIAGELMQAGASPSNITDLVYFNQTATSIKLLGKVLNETEYFFDNKLCILPLKKSMYKDASATQSDSEGLIDYTLRCHETEVGILFKEASEKITKVSLRSQDKIDVSKIAARFGGGGHFHAAGCQIEADFETARKMLIDLLEKELN